MLFKRLSVLTAALCLVAGLASMAFAPPASAAPTVRTQAVEDDLKHDCGNHKVEAGRKQGWARSRFERCHFYYKKLNLRNTNGQYLGYFDFDLWVLGFAYDGSRRVDYVALVENVHQSTSLRDELTHLTITYSGCYVNTVICSGPSQTDRTIAEWYRNSRVDTFIITSPDEAGDGPFKIVNFQLFAGFVGEYRDGRTIPESETDTATPRVRFDSAGAALGNGKFKGTVFPEHVPTLGLPLSGEGIDQEARHVDDALHHPERTFPSMVGKNVPGENSPLRRLMDSGRIEQNHSASVRVCKAVWGDDYASGGRECDEYPFKSTYEGSSTSTGNQPFSWHGSARPIDGEDNRKGGTKLGQFYGSNRTLDNDPFYVRVS